MPIGTDRFARARCLAVLLASVGVPALAVAGCGGSSNAAGPASADANGVASGGAHTTTTGAGAGAANVPAGADRTTTTASGDGNGTGAPAGSGAPAGTPGATAKNAPNDPVPSPGGSNSHRPAADRKSKSKSKAGAKSGGGTGAGTSGSGSGTGAGANAPSANTGVPFEVETSSMEPTFQPETKVYYDPTRTHPQVGDVIIFYLPAGGEGGACGEAMIGGRACDVPEPGQTKAKLISFKRVVGLPGDSIAIRDGRVIRNGQPASEPPLLACGKEEHVNCEFPTPIKVPADHYFVMADNRGLYKEDSRIFGPVPQGYILGTVEGS